MARILINNEWYEQVGASTLYEDEFRRILLDQAPRLFPNCWLVEFEPTVFSEYGSARPDLALIDRDYRGWWVVEAERGDHSLHGHVVPQVEVLARARYGPEEADALCRADHHLDGQRMVRGTQPQVLVIVNASRPAWSEALRPFGALVQIVEVFRSDQNSHIYRMNGDYPRLSDDILTLCYLDPVLPGSLVISSPATLQLGPSKVLNLRIGGLVTEWVIRESSDTSWLMPVGISPSLKRGKYAILKDQGGQLILQPHANL